MKTEAPILFITIHGDSSAGIFDQDFQVVFPYELDLENIDDMEEENLQDFKERITDAYYQHSGERTTSNWKHILMKEAKNEH